MSINVRRPGEDDQQTQTTESAQTRPLLTEIDHIAIAVPDLGEAIDYYRDTFGAVVDHREVVESDGVEEALLKVAESYVQLLTPDPGRLDRRQVAREARRTRASTTSATACRAAQRRSTPSRPRASGCSTTHPAPVPGARPWPSSIRRTPSAPSSSSSRSESDPGQGQLTRAQRSTSTVAAATSPCCG